MSCTPTIAMHSFYGAPLQPISFLPFLYNTQTIYSGSAYWSMVGRKRILNNNRPKISSRGKATSEFLGVTKLKLGPKRESVHRTKSYPAPFKPDHFQTLADKDFPEPTYDSTLTRGERQVFERIYREIIRELPVENSDVEDGDIEKEANEGLFDESSTLESIFEGSVWNVASSSCETGSLSRLSNIPKEQSMGLPPLRDVENKSPNKYAQEAETLRKSESSSPEREQSVAFIKSLQAQGFSKEHIGDDTETFQELLAATKSDKDIWDLLKNFVFSKMEAVAQEVVKQASERSAKMDDHNLAGKVKKEPAKSTAPDAAIAPLQVPWQQNPTIVRELSVLRVNYASQCAACLNMLRKKFPHSPYLLAVLPEIKSLGPISYVLGVSTELYNELLYVRWVHYRDLSGCADLVSEMLDRSVFPDARTRAVFNDAERTRSEASKLWSQPQDKTTRHKSLQKQKQPAMSPASAAWWLLQGVQSGWSKWQAIEAQVEEEEARRKVANVAAREDDYDEVDEYGELEEPTAYDENVVDDEPDIQVVVPAATG